METDGWLFRAEQVRAIEAATMARRGLQGIDLMEAAGLAAWELLNSRWPGARTVHVLCGGGNNGGDGWILATHALKAGCLVHVSFCGEEARLRGDAHIAYRRFMNAGGVVGEDAQSMPAADVRVDALLGIGFKGELRADVASLIRRLKNDPTPVLSIDVPSGVVADSGHVPDIAVEAAITLTYVGCKQGLLTGQGPAHTGELVHESLGCSEDADSHLPTQARLLSLQQLLSQLTRRSPVAHKGQFGQVLVVGGNVGMGGGAILAAEAALRSGAGLVSLATRPGTVTACQARRPEVMAHAVEHARDLDPLLARADVVAVGPGLGQDSWGQALLGRVLDRSIPSVIDADALNLLPRMVPEVTSLLGEGVLPPGSVITPHPGEASRLLGGSTGEVAEDRFGAVRKLQSRYGAEVVLKGAGSLVATRDTPVGVCRYGNPGMASGGMGDALTGIVAGLLATGASSGLAAQLGVCLHARAADLAVAKTGQSGLLASDVIDYLAMAGLP